MVDGGVSVGMEAGEATAAASEAEKKAKEAEAQVDAYKAQQDKRQLSDDLLTDGSLIDGGDSKHLILFKKPRKGKTSGYLNHSVFVNLTNNPQVKEELEKNGFISYKEDDEEKKNPIFDAYGEYGGQKNYTEFLKDMNDVTNSDPTKLFTQDLKNNKGIVPKDGISQEQISLAFDVWEQKKKLKELQEQQQTQKTEAVMSDDGGVVPDESPQPISEIEAEKAKLQQAEEKLASQAKIDQEAQKKEELRGKKITAEDARAMLIVLKGLNQGKKEVIQQLSNLGEDDDPHQLQEKLDEIVDLQITEMMRAIGYSEDDIAEIKGGADSDLPLVLQLARHTSNSKDIQSPEVQELCVFVKQELISSVQEIINRGEEDGKKSTWNQVREMKGFAALRKVMGMLGIQGDAQNAKVGELWESVKQLGIVQEGAKDEEGKEIEQDSLSTLLEVLVTGEPKPEVKKSFKTYFEELKKEFQKTGKDLKEFDKWVQEKVKALHPEVGAAAAQAVSAFLEEHLDLGRFMEMLLVGDYYTSLASDLGYKSKEQLLAEGKKPVGVEDVDWRIRKDGNRVTNSRNLLVAGLKDVIPEEQRMALLSKPAKDVLKDPAFKEMLKNTVDKDRHKLIVVNMLEFMDYGDEKTQEANKVELTNEAFSYIMSLPDLIDKLKWEDGEGYVVKKDEGNMGKMGVIKPEDKKEEAKSVDSPTTEVPEAEMNAVKTVSTPTPTPIKL